MGQITRRTFLRGAAATAGAAALGGPFLGFQPPSLDPPDLIFHHGRILTMAATQPAAEAIAIASRTIVAVGSNREIQALRGPRTVAVNLQGRALLPGFVDAHSHRLGDWSLRYPSPEAAVEDAMATGWTTISELFASQDRLDLLTELDAAGHLPIDVNAYLPINYGFDRFGDWYLAYDPDQQLSPHVRVAGIKVFIDSGAQDEKLLSEPYANHPDFYGLGFWNQSDLDAAVRAAHDAGFQVAAHTGGDAAHDLILNAYAAALGGAPNAPRHRVEHVMIARDDQVARMAALGLIGSIQLSFFNSDWAQEFAAGLGPDRVPWVGRWRDLLDAGVPTTGSTDAPYGYGTTGPAMRAIYQAVTRIGETGAPPPPWMLSQRISVEEALRLLTIDAAWGCREEATKGSLERGKRADIVVLSTDPTAIDPAGLADVEVLMTMVAGESVFCAPGEHALCRSA
jgi:predicted amidohydrolase YtcJ